MSLTTRQLGLFWPLFTTAWLAHCTHSGASSSCANSREQWRHQITQETCGAPSIKDVTNSTFDDLMLRLAQEANKTREICYWSDAIERRYRHLINGIIYKLNSLDPSNHYGPAYVDGIFSQAKMSKGFNEAPAKHLQTALKMLTKHYCRLKAKTPCLAADHKAY